MSDNEDFEKKECNKNFKNRKGSYESRKIMRTKKEIFKA